MSFRIQIIDDNVALTTLLAKALAKFGYEPVVENNPLLAINTVRHYMPDLILLDVMMPERDGGRVLADLRNDLSLRYIPVILLTAIAREAQALAGTGGIQSIVMAKPVQLQELLAVIEAQLKSGMSYQQLQSNETSFAPPFARPLEVTQLEDEFPWQDGGEGHRASSMVASAFDNPFPAREPSSEGPERFFFPGRDETLPS